LETNGSPPPVFETDAKRTYFLSLFRVHPAFLKLTLREQASEQDGEQVNEQVEILKYCLTPRKKAEILKHISLSIVYMNYKRHISPLVQKRLLGLTIPQKPNSKIGRAHV
jgi:ATP-dependent DNA helicase RecG